LECSKNSKIYKKDGKQRKEIDYWSAGILLHEFFYGFLPLSYTSCMGKDIQTLWSSEFLYLPRSLKKRGLNAIESIFHLISYLMIQIPQTNRLPVWKAYSIIDLIEKYHKEIFNFCSGLPKK
jgi:hypothetical protein